MFQLFSEEFELSFQIGKDHEKKNGPKMTLNDKARETTVLVKRTEQNA